MVLEKVKNFIISKQLIKAGDKIVAACSGGPDSLALVDILGILAAELNFQLAVAHVDHMFRGEESAADARFVQEFCQRRGLICHLAVINVPQYLTEFGGSAEDTARRLRYQYLHEVAASWGDAKIATGHHQDDQVETVLLHLFRGSGANGLAGIKAKRDLIIRPLLALTHGEIIEYCRSAGLEPRQDSTNLSLQYLRNRLRLSIIPYLEGELGTGIRQPLRRTAQILAEQQELLQSMAEAAWPDIASETDDFIMLSLPRLTKQHIALQRIIFRMAIEKKRGSLTGITFQHVEKLIDMAEFWAVGSKLALPGGLRAERGYDTIRFYLRQIPAAPGIAPPGQPIRVPGDTLVPELGLIIKAAVHSALPKSLGQDSAVFDYAALSQPLYVRTRQPGDRFSPKGMHGTKKLKDFFIDNKIPRDVRDRAPIFCDREGHIFWIGGLRCSRHAQVTAQTTDFLLLQIIKLQEAQYEYDE